LWLGRKASYVTAAWESSLHRNTRKFNMQSSHVVDCNSEIFEACGDGDVERMKVLFDNTQASPFDVTQFGENLLMVRAPYSQCL
jgi:hypothetical protein